MSGLTKAKAGITRTDIRALIGRFYWAVRQDRRLGPIFYKHVGSENRDWAKHLARIEDFWANVMLRDRAYQGNPMQVHMKIADIRSQDFDRWLSIFEQTAITTLPPLKAQVFTLLARRIARSLSMGITRTRDDGAPRLTD